MERFSNNDVALVRAAASLAAHAPEGMRAAHLAVRLEALARRLESRLAREAAVAEPPAQLPRAA